MVRNKKAVSTMVGYVMLVSFGIVMSVIVFNYLQTYVPKDILACPDGSSMFLKDYSYDCTTHQLNISLKNNGKFNLAGFFINAANNTEQQIATYDLSKNLTNKTNRLYGNAIVVNLKPENLILPNGESNYIFNHTGWGYDGNITLIEIIPMRFEEENNKIRPITCSIAKIKEELICN